MKHPPRQYPDTEALRLTRVFIEGAVSGRFEELKN
jgi:hypothetical protein